MSNETMTLTDAQAAEFGFAPASTEPSTPVAAVEATNVAAVTPPVTTPPTDKPVESVSPKTETPAAEGKSLYTPEEIEEILKTDGTLDSSRLDANGKLLQKSFQRGTTQKFEQAKKMTEEAAKIRADAESKLAEFNRRQKEIEDQKVFQKEAEELGEEEAARRKEIREIREEQAQLRWERDQARQRESSMQIQDNFRQVAPKFFVPEGQVYQDIILSSIVAGDMLRVNGGSPPRTIEESTAMFSDALGLTNVENLWKIIRANPENETAVKNYYFNEHVKSQAKGPTVSASSAANVQTPKPPVDSIDPNKSTMDEVLSHFGVSKLNEINLT